MVVFGKLGELEEMMMVFKHVESKIVEEEYHIRYF